MLEVIIKQEVAVCIDQDYQSQVLHRESLNPQSPFPSLKIQGDMEKKESRKQVLDTMHCTFICQ